MAQHDPTLGLSDEPCRGNSWRKTAMMTGLVVLGMAERLSAVGNTLVMERDWVQASLLSGPGHGY